MADVHVHHTDADRSADNSVALLVFTLIAILAVAAFAFFAFNGTLFRQTAPAATGGTSINGTVNIPGNTAPGATTPTAPNVPQ